MTAFLSREQEFHKINEQLDNMTNFSNDKSQINKMDLKFSTFTKKGPSAVLRQAGIKMEDLTLAGLKEKSPNSMSKDSQIMTGSRKKPGLRERPLQSIGEDKKHYHERGSTNSPRHSARTLPIRNSLAKNSSNVVVRYKNSSFIQSPSLEVLVKGENESIRSQCTSRSSEISGPKINLSSEGLIKYLKSRIAILQEEHETLTREMLNQKELVEKSVERQKKIESQRDMAYTRNNTLTDQMGKLEVQLEDAVRRLKEKDADHNETRKELEAVKRDLKVITQTHANLEKRLYRANEELENTRNTMNQLKNAEKEIKESARSETDAQEKQIKALKKQRADLLNAYKKQLFLIDNLKRQNICMEQSRMVAFGEKEFSKVLDWQAKN